MRHLSRVRPRIRLRGGTPVDERLPVITPHPAPSPLQALQSHRSTLNTEYARLTQERNLHVSSLSKELRDISNRCRDVDARNEASCGSHVKVLRERQALLSKTSGFSDSQRLRMKSRKGEHCIVKMESRSLLKHLLGVGRANRKQQAADLVTHLGLSGKAITRSQLKMAVTQAQEAVRHEMEAGVQRELPQIIEAFVSTAERVGFRREAVEGALIEATQNRLFLEPAFDAASRALTKAYADKIDGHYQDDLRVLKTKINSIQVETERLQAEQKEAQQQKLVNDRSVVLKRNGVILPKENADALQQSLSTRLDETRFSDIYHTNAGCRAIQEMFQSGAHVPYREVIAEIERTHGDTIFAQGARRDKFELKDAAKTLSSADLREIDASRHMLGLARYASGAPMVRTFRRAVHSRDMVQRLQEIAGKDMLLKPMRFMSTALNREGTAAFPAKPPSSGEVVNFEIQGFSSMATHSQWNVKGEGQERLYGPCSHFWVQSMQRDAGGWVARLVEQPVMPDHPRAIELGR